MFGPARYLGRWSGFDSSGRWVWRWPEPFSLIPAGRSVCCGSDLMFVEPALTLQTSPSGWVPSSASEAESGFGLAGETESGPTVVGLGGIQGPLSPRLRFRLEAKARALGSSASIVSVAAGFSVSNPAAPK